jgi:alkanesulfonate monooxygenase SsuD/methylene tetrahydromethanopterin reductase-like flavin-dependent oxidoreductase (luciferase family)
VEVHLLAAGDAATLREQAKEAATGGAAAVFITESSLGDPLVLAAGLAAAVPDVRLGARMTFSARSRHPAMLAREVTSLDLVCGGRSAVCFTPPFADTLAEAITLCRALWEVGEVVSEGPHFPVRAGRNRARPLGRGDTGPIVVIDLTGGETLPGALDGLIDLVLRPTARPAVCAMERP